MRNSLTQLSSTYEECIRIQQRIIDSNRTKLKEAHKKYNMKEVQRLNSLLKVLYDEKAELENAVNEMTKYLQ